MNNLIELLQHQELVWQGTTKVPGQEENLSTGFGELDQQLDGGFLKTGVTEIQSSSGIGELRLLLPVLQQAVEEQRLVVFISPEGMVMPEALGAFGFDLDKILIVYPKEQKDALWAAEQCLKSGACHSVVMWTKQALEIHQVKRLQVASDTGNCRQFVIRESKTESLSLPFTLSLSLQPHPQGLTAKINKRKRGWPSGSFVINMAKRWPALSVQDAPDNLLHFPKVKAG